MITATFGMLGDWISRFLFLLLKLCLALLFTAPSEWKQNDWVAAESLNCIHILVVLSVLRRFGRQFSPQTLTFGVGSRGCWLSNARSWLWSVNHTDPVRVRWRGVPAELDAKRIVLPWSHLWFNLMWAFASHHAWCGRGRLQISHLVFYACYALRADWLSVNWSDWRLSRRAIVDHFRTLSTWLSIVLNLRLLLRWESGGMGVGDSSK